MIGSGAMSGKQRTGNMKTFRCNWAVQSARKVILTGSNKPVGIIT